MKNEEEICAKCRKADPKNDLQRCFDCKKYYCLDCVYLIETDECSANRIKYYVKCPVNQKHHMNSVWL